MLLKNKKSLIFALIILEIVVIVSLAGHIIKIKSSTLGVAIVNPINKDSFQISPTDDLKHFFEPRPNTVERMKYPSLPNQAIHTINSDTLNERFDYSIEKPDNTFRIITLGDSFTFGAWFDTRDNYPEQLEELLNNNCKKNNFEVINLGVSGYDIKYSVERFLRRGKKYNPDLVLWLFKADDFVEIAEETRPKIEDLVNRFEKEGTFDEKLSSGEFGEEAAKIKQELTKKYTKETVLEYQKEALSSLRNYFDGTLVYLSFNASQGDEDRNLLSELSSKESKIYYHGNLPNIWRIDGASIAIDEHPTDKGYAIISGDIFNFLIKQKLIPCN